MIVTETLQYKRLVRMRDLGLAFHEQLPEGSAEIVVGLATTLNLLATLAGSQLSAAHRAKNTVVAGLKRDV